MSMTQQELESTVTGTNETDNAAVLATRKVTKDDGADFYEVLETLREAEVKRGTRPQTKFAPVPDEPVAEAEKPREGPSKPPRDLTLFERTDIQRAEVQLQMHRRTEEMLVELVRFAEGELTGVRRSIAGIEAQLAVHDGAG